eukprot:7722710-Pyramimonas_sp.AAC.1
MSSVSGAVGPTTRSATNLVLAGALPRSILRVGEVSPSSNSVRSAEPSTAPLPRCCCCGGGKPPLLLEHKRQRCIHACSSLATS